MANEKEQRIIDIIVKGTQANASINEIAAAQRVLNSEIKKMGADDPRREQLIKQYSDLAAKQREVRTEMNNTGGAMSKLTGLLGPLGMAFSAAFVVDKVVGFFRNASKAEKEFEVSLSELSAITGASEKDLRFYRQEAEKVGRSTTHAADEMVTAYKLIGSAKPELLKNKEALAATAKEILVLSDASKMTLPDATDAAIGALNQFGEGADQTRRYINVLAAGAKEGSSEIKDTAASLKNAGTVAAAAGLNIEQTVATIQGLAEISIKGGEAGTGLRNVLLTLQAGAKETNPVVVGYDKALENLANRHLSAAEMAKMFGKENVVVAQQMVNSREKIGALTKAVTGTSEAYDQAAKNTNNLEGDTKRLMGVVDGFLLSAGKGINSVVRVIVQFATALLERSQPIIDLFQAWGNEMGALWKDILDVFHALGLFVDKASAAEIVMKILVLALRLVIEPLKAMAVGVRLIVEGLIELWNTGARVVGGIRTTMQQLSNIFSEFRANVVRALGGLADIFEGIFTMNPAKIQAGFRQAVAGIHDEALDAGKKAGAAFSAGYTNAAGVIKRHKSSADAPEDPATGSPDAVGTDNADKLAAQRAAAEAAAEDAAEKARAKREKAADDGRKRELKAQEDADRSALAVWQAIQDLQVAAIPDKTEREIAAINLAYERKMDTVQGNEEEQTIQLELLEAERQQKIQAVRDAAAEEAERKRREGIDAQLADEASDQEAQIEMLQSAIDRGLMAEQQYADAVYQVKRTAKENEIELLRQKFGEESAEVAKAMRQLRTMDAQQTKDAKKEAKDRADFQNKMEQTRLETFREVVSGVIDLMGEESKANDAMKALRKTLSLVQIGINLAMEMSANAVAAANMNAILPGSGVAWLPWQNAQSLIRFGVSTAKILAFREGGNTMMDGEQVALDQFGSLLPMLSGASGGSFAGGGPQRTPRLGLIGEAGPELVIPNWLYTAPPMANLMGALEGMIATGQVARPLAAGGVSSGVGSDDRTLSTQSLGAGDVTGLLSRIIGEMVMMREDLTTWQRELQVVMPWRDFDRDYTSYKKVNEGGGIKP